MFGTDGIGVGSMSTVTSLAAAAVILSKLRRKQTLIDVCYLPLPTKLHDISLPRGKISLVIASMYFALR